jgi:hypothetical protein
MTNGSSGSSGSRGVKSKYFGVYWDSMFLTALGFPEKVENKTTLKHYKQYFESFKYILPCKFCREFIVEKLDKEFPHDFSGRKQLIFSIYLRRDAVNKKLISQGCKTTKPSPPFEVILKRLEKKYATCNATVGKCL